MLQNERWFWLTVTLLAAGILYLLSPILTPFMVAAFFAYLGDPVTDWLERYMPRGVAVSFVFVVIFILLVSLGMILVPVLESQISRLLTKLPLYLQWIRETFMPWFESHFGQSLFLINLDELQRLLVQHWKEAGGLVSGFLRSISRSGFALLGWLANLVLIPVLTFYLLRDWDKMLSGIRALLPRKSKKTVLLLAVETDEC